MFWHWKVSIRYLKISLTCNSLIFLWYKISKVYQLACVEFESRLPVWPPGMLVFFPQVSELMGRVVSSHTCSTLSSQQVVPVSWNMCHYLKATLPVFLGYLMTGAHVSEVNRQAGHWFCWDEEQLYSQGGKDKISLWVTVV